MVIGYFPVSESSHSHLQPGLRMDEALPPCHHDIVLKYSENFKVTARSRSHEIFLGNHCLLGFRRARS
jgi:GMP synthase-like glutamine amidotransferase